ncbi:HvfC/BufC N-terminal domain-containing protein [Acidihalobacter prosperus]|uniref:DUF2063 domain-containing protein n=1 Tax=Acidihalobacter prosperus TaxID=160660 RepID=A0A1A6C8G0_9GAMM|nr:DNA-binding domain-containing protein [Acidihalobacter prosperus]OBS10835.1 DUF2063 domain-containing protein [Acidihalobacter prosperus]
MPKLAECQAAFAAALTDPTRAGSVGLRDGVLDPARRLAVYRNNTAITQTEALAGIYPAVQQLVGEDFFAALAAHYREHHPSRSGDLRDFGAELADFIARFDAAAGLPYLPDVARLEWAWHCCFHAAEARALDPAGLARIAAAREPELSLIPAARLLHSPYPVAEIWGFALDPERRQGTLDLDTLPPAHLLVARPEDEVYVLALDPPDHHWLSGLAAGSSLSDALAATLAAHPGFDLAERLPALLELGLFVAPDAGESS